MAIASTSAACPSAKVRSIPTARWPINPGRVFGQLKGIPTKDPAFGMEAVWIEPSTREHAQTLGYTVVDASTVVATHLSHIVQMHAHELLGHEEVQHLLNTLQKSAPEAGRRPGAACDAALHPWCACCRGCWPSACRSRTSARSSKLWRNTPRARRIRSPCRTRCASRLGRQIVQDIAGIGGELPVITLEPELERLLSNSIGGASQNGAAEPRPRTRVGRTLATTVGRVSATSGAVRGTRGAAGGAADPLHPGPLHARRGAGDARAGLERDSRQPEGPVGDGGRTLGLPGKK